MKKVVIIGNGQIGSSIYRVITQKGERIEPLIVDIRDKESALTGDYDIMIVTIPFKKKKKFIKQVREYEKLYSPSLVIIHSTVKPGTTRELGEKYVHIPISGKHPDLTNDIINNYTMFVGGIDWQAVEAAGNFYAQFVKTPVIDFDSPEETEFAKLLSTTYYGWNVLFEKEVHRLCEKYNMDFDCVYREWNNSYNQGMERRGTRYFQRPVLKHMPGPIGGHCVIPNAEILQDESYIAKLILEKNKEFEE